MEIIRSVTKPGRPFGIPEDTPLTINVYLFKKRALGASVASSPMLTVVADGFAY